MRKKHFTVQKTKVYIVCSLLLTVLLMLWIRSVISKLFVHVTLALHELIQLLRH